MIFSKEKFHLPASVIVWTGLALVGILILISFLLWIFQNRLTNKIPLTEISYAQSPRQQVEFESGRLARRSRELQQQKLEGFSWEDGHHQFARIPIEKAMDFLTQEEK